MFSHYQACKVKLLKKEEAIELAYAIQEGDFEAREKLILHNMRLVFNIARSAQRRTNALLDDLISYGYLGLIGAAENYRPWDHNWVAFSTYATFWIRRAIANGIVDERLIRMPRGCELDLMRWNMAIQKMMSTGDRFTVEDVKRESGLSDTRIENVMLAIAVASSKQDRWDGMDHGEILPDDEPKVEFDQKSPAIISEMIDKLKPREARVLRARCGIGCEPMSLMDLGKELGLTKERVRQIEVKAKVNLLKIFQKSGLGFDDMYKIQDETSEL